MATLQELDALLRNRERISRQNEVTRTARCIHRHTKEEHPNCFKRGLYLKPNWWEGLAIASVDIESSNFDANAGFMLSWAVKVHNGGPLLYDVITKDEIFDLKFDKRISKSLVDVLKTIDIIVSYYGTGFDIPFMRTRALYWGQKFPYYGTIYNFDVYYRVKRLLKLHRNSLDAATRFFGIEGKDHVLMDIWNKARYGDPKALDYVVNHNLEDVKILEDLFKKVERYSAWTRKSI